MKLSRLYCNRPDIFGPIEFNPGLNVVLAEIRLPENRNRDVHNLGKTLLGDLLDFCFLADAQWSFLVRKDGKFSQFDFFLEIQLNSGEFLTVARSPARPTKISFKRHDEPNEACKPWDSDDWNHHDLAFDKAKLVLDGYLNLGAYGQWPYRKGIGYQIRSQEDYQDVFQLGRFRGAHSDWKPFISHILGFDSDLIVAHYEKDQQLKDMQATLQTVLEEMGGGPQHSSEIEGMLLIQKAAVASKTKLIETFDFSDEEKLKTLELVEKIDARTVELNNRRYALTHNERTIVAAIKKATLLFDIDSAQQLFKEAGIMFEGQIKRDFEQLLGFNEAITGERNKFLREDLKAVEQELSSLDDELSAVADQRSQNLRFLQNSNSLEKFRQASSELAELKASLMTLERRKDFKERLKEMRREIRQAEDAKKKAREQVEASIEETNGDASGLFAQIRLFFNEIVEQVIDSKALLTVNPNKNGHPEFGAAILDADGAATAADGGHSYRKLLCMAFDLALLRALHNYGSPRFAFHDGAFESLDDRKKLNLVEVLRSYADMGIQTVITVIDTDLPALGQSGDSTFGPQEIILRLHDEGAEGRLFRMPKW